ncbi:MAG: hypothetical protein MK100_03765 [Phycisphaerales bacterium]|nr:hypothetical protein [Phycisphaerales bacterium]
MRNECEEEKRNAERGESDVEIYTIASSWKCSDWFPAKISACCTALAFVCVIALFIFAFDVLFGRGFTGGTAGLGLVLMYIPVLGIAIVGLALNCIVLVRRRQCEKKLAILNLFFLVIPLLPVLLILLQIIRVLLGFG